MRRVVNMCVGLVLIAGLSSGCATAKKAQRVDELEMEVARLRSELVKAQQAEEKVSDLERAKRDLARKLERELKDYKAKLEMTERGLVITFLAEVFFDSGMAKIKKQGQATLTEVGSVLNEDVVDSFVAIEGHTDSDPIVKSGWKSNWELSSARALAVLHYFVDECQVAPERLSANAYGEYKPVASNDTDEGKQQNRRVEIVILPPEIKKIK